ncbi:MAG: zinc-binding dehydrogenase [Coriobacteriia bacterium]
MKGWLFTNTHVPLKLVEQPDPVIEPGKVIIDIKASGLCHSDVGALEDEGWLEIITKLPVIMGHEFAGVIAEVGEGVTEYKVGDRVGVCPIGEGGSPGYQYDGGYADKVMVPAGNLVPIPENVSFAQGAAATDAGMTSYHAMFVTGGAKPGMKVGVIGIGGLGQIAGRAAVVAGCEVYGVDLSPAARDLGRELGMADVFENVTDLAAIAPDLIVDYAGFGTTTAQAIEVVAVGGTVVQVGMGRLEATINTRLLITKTVRLLGSMGGNNDDIANCYALMSSGDLDPLITEITFDEIGEGLDRLAAGGVKGRLVAIL